MKTSSRVLFILEAKKRDLLSSVLPLSAEQHRTAREIMGGRNPLNPDEAACTPADDRLHHKHYLSKSLYPYVPMTPRQKIMVNVALLSKGAPEMFLSPRQLHALPGLEPPCNASGIGDKPGAPGDPFVRCTGGGKRAREEPNGSSTTL